MSARLSAAAAARADDRAEVILQPLVAFAGAALEARRGR